MRTYAIVAAALSLAGCATAPRAIRPLPDHSTGILSASPYPDLKRRIDALLPDSLFPPSNAAIRIVSAERGEVLYDLNPALTFTPASNQKLFTSATALSELGPDYTFTTRIAADTTAPATLYVRGSGDPLLATADIDSLAAQAARALPAGFTWHLAGDVSLFDDLSKGYGWTWDDEPDPTGMFISPLSLNGNAIRILVRPGMNRGDSARVATDPLTSYVTIENSARTTADTPRTELVISRKWREHSNTITVEGGIRPADTLVSELLSIAGPEWYTLTVLRERLEAHGLRCSGILLDTVPPRLPAIAAVSHRLDSVLTYMNLESDNLSAENVLKTVAAEKSGLPGSAPAGASIMARFLAGLGVDTTRIVIADGSGLSRYNLTSAGAVVNLLFGMRSLERIFPSWYATLPVAGVSGTIATRMKGTPAQGNLRAKTGTLAGVSSLSGYVTMADGEQLAFSILMQHFPAGARRYRQVQDRIGAFLAELKRSGF